MIDKKHANEVTTEEYVEIHGVPAGSVAKYIKLLKSKRWKVHHVVGGEVVPVNSLMPNPQAIPAYMIIASNVLINGKIPELPKLN